MDTARYKAFLATAESGSIKNASEAMDYTPSAVSQLIKSLEKDLGVTLLLRGKKGIELTTAGEELIPTIRQLLACERQLFQTAGDLKGTVSGTINVAAYHSVIKSWMPDIISGFQEKYPNVRINLFEGTQKDIIERLTTGRSQIAIFNDSAMTGKYDWIPLGDDMLVAILPKDHPLANEKSFNIRNVVGERFLMPELGYDFDVLALLTQAKVKADTYLSTFDSTIILKMVEKGMGISIVNGLSLPSEDRNISVLPLDPPSYMNMGIAVMSMRRASPAVKKFAEFAEELVKSKFYSS